MSMDRITWRGIILAAALCATGCDRLPGFGKSDSSSSDAATPAAAPAVPAPAADVNVPESERVAVVNGTPLAATDVELALQELKRYVELNQQTWQPLPAEDRGPDQLDLVDVLANLTDVELKAQDAKAARLDSKTDIQRRLRYLQRSFFAQEWDAWQRDKAKPTDQEIREFYEANKLGFVVPEVIRVRQIVTATLADAEAARAKAIQGAPFASLAAEFSIGAGKEAGGDVGGHVRAQDAQRLILIDPQAANTTKVFFPQLEPVAFALELEQISQPVKGPDGYYLVQLTERTPGKQRTELEVRDMIAALLTQQQMQQRLDELKKKAKVETHPERLTNVVQ